MNAFTQLVLDLAVRQLATWRAAGVFTTVAVHRSTSDLLDEQLTSRIEALLAEHGVPVDALAVRDHRERPDDRPRARARRAGGAPPARRAHRRRRLRHRLLLPAYLRDLPIDELKIDRAFVARIVVDPRSAAIVDSTIDLAHALELQVVAEGVEDQEVLAALDASGCDFAQGYHLSRRLRPTRSPTGRTRGLPAPCRGSLPVL